MHHSRGLSLLGQRIAKHRVAIDATLEHRLSNGLVESTNTKIRLLTRMAFGSKSPEAMIALAMLNLGGCCPPLPRPSGRMITPTETPAEPQKSTFCTVDTSSVSAGRVRRLDERPRHLFGVRMRTSRHTAHA